MVCRLEECCCGNPLRVGCKSIACLQMTVGILRVIISIPLVYLYIEHTNSEDEETYYDAYIITHNANELLLLDGFDFFSCGEEIPVEKIVCMIAFCVLAAMLIPLATLLIIATKMETIVGLYLWIFGDVTHFVASTLFTFHYFSPTFIETHFLPQVSIIILIVIAVIETVLRIYFVVVVHSYAIELLEKRRENARSRPAT